MSFEVYVQCFEKGEPAGLARQKVREVFGKFLAEKERDLWQVRYDKMNSCDLYLSGDEEDTNKIKSLMVSRPCSDRRLWDGLAAILKLGNVVLYFPGCGAPMVSRSSVTRHLPVEMIERMGRPVCVATGKEIAAAVEEA
jgi:hypothetical protein